MRTLIGTLAALLLCGCVSVAQQTPPAEGTGLGEPHTTNDSNAARYAYSQPRPKPGDYRNKGQHHGNEQRTWTFGFQRSANGQPS